MKNYIYILIFLVSISLYSQQEKKETVYLWFNNYSKEKCKIGVESTYENPKGIKIVNKYRKIERKKRITFYVCEESFLLDRRNKIDTCDIKYLSKIKFETLQTIESKRVVSKYAFKSSVFEKIYLIEKQKDRIIKYPVIWNTDLVQK